MKLDEARGPQDDVQPCRREDHEAAKATPEAFAARTRPGFVFDGVEYRHCIRCGSTIGREIAPTAEARQ